MAAWVYTTDAANNQTPIGIFDKSKVASGWFLSLEGSVGGDPVRAIAATPTYQYGQADTSSGFSTSTWHHVAGVFTSSTSRAAYLDGGNKGTNSTSIVPTGPFDETCFSGYWEGGVQYNSIDGYIAECAIWNAALTDAEVAALAAGYSPLLIRPANLVFYVPLIRDADEDIVGGLSLTANGTPTVEAHPRIYYPVPHSFQSWTPAHRTKADQFDFWITDRIHFDELWATGAEESPTGPQTGSVTANAAIQRAFSDSATADAVIARTETDSVTADATVLVTQSASVTADAAIQASQADSATADAAIQRTFSGSVTADALITLASVDSITADAAILATQVDSITTDAVIFQTGIGSITADTAILAGQTGSITADASIGSGQTDSITVDADITCIGKPTWVSPPDAGGTDSTPVLVFTIPYAPSNIHFRLELDTVVTFDSGDYQKFESWSDQTNWEYDNGASWQPFPAGGVSNIYAGNQCRYSISSSLDAGTWYRVVRGALA
jgi:hypothetical protein